MDYQRIFILLGLAVTAYLLILAWNNDYNRTPVETDVVTRSATNTDVSTTELPSPAAGMDAVQATDGVQETNIVPELDVVPDLDPVSPTQPAQQIAPDTGRLVQVETDVFSLTIDTLGGDITYVSLPEFPNSLDTPDNPFVLVDPRNSYSAQSGLIGSDGTDNTSGRPLYTTVSHYYSLDDKDQLTVVLTLPDAGDGLVLRKEFEFNRSDYLIRINYTVENQTDKDWSAAIFAQIKRDGQDPFNMDSNLMGMKPYIGGATWTPDTPYQKLEFEDLEEELYKDRFANGYMAMVQHYFVSAFIPEGDGENTYQARKLPGQDIYLLGFTTPVWTVPRGGIDSRGVQFYTGPKDQYRLKEITRGLDLTIDYGFLWWLAQPLFYLLTFIQGYVINWGIAIILLTCIVRLLLYPLSAAGLRSNAKMRKVQPQMVRLKEKYGDDRQKFSQEMMNLYKKEGANPLGGCFPILLQMPVFIALYWVLLESVEIRQAPFALWIKDLSAMDPYFVLPILMGISMYFVTLMQPEPPDPMQAKIFKMMPIVFTFFFLWFPAGLVLYWLASNILSILQQWYVTRKLEAGG